MNRQNQGNNNRPSVAATAATVAIGAAVGYGAYKLFQSMFGAAEPQPSQSNIDNFSYDDGTAPENFFEKTISVVKTVQELQDALEELALEFNESKVLGFDCEWAPSGSGRRKVAILQLCSHSGLCYIIQLSQLRHIPANLKALLESSRIIKVGVAPFNDAKFLHEDYGVRVAGTLDLRYMAKAAGCFPGGLKMMTERYLRSFGFLFYENARCSDWENPNLSHEQIQYAASDVEASIELCKYFAEKIAPRKDVDYTIKNYCSQFIDKSFIA